MSQGRQLRGWPDRPGNEPGLVLCRELLGNFAGKLSSFEVDFPNAVPELKLSQNDARPTERISFDDIAPHPQKICMNFANDIRPAQYQNFTAVFFAPIIVECRIALVNIGAHRAVIDDDALAHGLEEVFHCFYLAFTKQICLLPRRFSNRAESLPLM